MNLADRLYKWLTGRSAGLTAAAEGPGTLQDEALARRLEELRPVPAPRTLASARHTFLTQAARLRAESLTAARPGWPAAFRWTPLRPGQVGARAGLRLALTSAIALCAFVGVMAGVTLARVAPAAQASLPGDRLYAFKIGQEDLRAALTFNATSRVDLGLEFAGERAMELLALAQAGRPMPMETVTRLHQNLQTALLAASQLPDPQMQIALQKIQQVSRSAQATLERAEASARDAQSRAALQWVEQVAANSQALVQQGLADPQAFRIQMGSAAAPATATPTPTPAWLNPTQTAAINPPFIPTATPVSYPVAPTATNVLFNPTLAPVTPTATGLPFNPTPTPVPYIVPTSTNVPFNPTLAPVTPTATGLPFNPTPTPVPYIVPTSTNVPYNPTPVPVAPTATPVPYVAPTPTNVPYNPTLAPAAPTATPTP